MIRRKGRQGAKDAENFDPRILCPLCEIPLCPPWLHFFSNKKNTALDYQILFEISNRCLNRN